MSLRSAYTRGHVVRRRGRRRSPWLGRSVALSGLTILSGLFGVAYADTEISSSTTTALTTATGGNIDIVSGGSVDIQTASSSAITMNSNHYVLNYGSISNTGVSAATGIKIDTSGGSIFPASSGLVSAGTIDVGGKGTEKYGILIDGGNTFYAPVTLTSLSASLTSSGQSSSILVKGDSSSAIYLTQGTSITSNLILGGGGIIQNASDNSTASNSVIVNLSGTLNGNLVNNSGISGVGPGIVGIRTLGGIHSCASDLRAPAGFGCPTSSGGAFLNAGNISLTGIASASSRGNNPESGSAIAIGGSIDGGFVNYGPGTSSNATAVTVSASGVVTSSGVAPTILIDPTLSAASSGANARAPVILGPVAADIDGIDPGYSVINRGTINAFPTDAEISSAAFVIQGQSSTYYTCLSAVVSSCSLTPTAASQAITDSAGNINSITYQKTGGLLNTGTIAAQATTNSQTTTSAGTISATALYIGAFATVPRLDVKAESVNSTTKTPATISALVSGVGQGNAYALLIASGANLPLVNVSRNGSIVASVTTTTTSPTSGIATQSAPFYLLSEAIVDQSNTLATINNSGLIQAVNTTLTPGAGAYVSSVERAIDLSASTIDGIQINNSGRILGDVLFGGSGNGAVLNVGNINPSGNPATGTLNSASSYAIVAGSIVSESSGSIPTTTSAYLDFGSGTGQTLRVGSYGYVNADIRTHSAGQLAVQVDADGYLYVANTTSSVQVSTLRVAANGTLGLAISSQNLNSTTPVIQASSNAVLSGANIGLAFGTYIAAADPQKPTTQTITLIQAPVITDTTLAAQNANLGQNTPFLFESPASANIVAGDNGPTPLSIGTSSGQQTLLLKLLPRSVNATNADGSPGLNLSNSAKNQFPFVTSALANDAELGAVIASSLTVYKTSGVPSSGINVAASQQRAQEVFSQFSPDVSGGTRGIAIMLTDQATGPVAARQRLLRSYGRVPGETTIWAQEFTGQINNKGQVGEDGTLVTYKDRGWGFSIGADGGSPRNGWYGGAFTFYTGDVAQQLPRATITDTNWYMFTGYTHWQGKKLFLDTQLSAAYGHFVGLRELSVGGITRSATSKRAGAMAAIGAKTGLMWNFFGLKVDPYISLDALTLREEGFREANGGSGFNLDVAPYFGNSLRAAVGADIKGTIKLWGVNFTPEGRFGYRHEMLKEPVKVDAAFQSTGGRGTAGNTFTFVGPDPDKGSTIAGLSFGFGEDSWHLGVNYDWIRGDNATTTQVGTVSLLGRI